MLFLECCHISTGNFSVEEFPLVSQRRLLTHGKENMFGNKATLNSVAFEYVCALTCIQVIFSSKDAQTQETDFSDLVSDFTH